jgi:hypothetical protein
MERKELEQLLRLARQNVFNDDDIIADQAHRDIISLKRKIASLRDDEWHKREQARFERQNQFMRLWE